MRAYHGAGAFAVEVQVADLQLMPRPLQLLARRGINGAGQAELSVVADLQRVVVVAGFDYGQHQPEDFFLGNARHGCDILDHSGLNEVAFAGFLRRTAAEDHAAFLLADVDVIEDRAHGAFIDHRPHGFVLRGIAHGDFAYAVFQAFQKNVVDFLVHDSAGAGRALLSLKPERRNGHAFNRSVQVGVVGDNDGVLTAHL